jgi:CelD/BcsL family acetyltransferase involved in cellulose biosynthesis
MFSVDTESARGAVESGTRLDPADTRIRSLGGVREPAVARFLTESGEALSLTVTSTLAPIATDWRALQQRAPVSPYQTFDLAEAWVLHAAEAAGFEPRIGVVRNAAGDVVMILPFGLVRRLGTVVGVYLGGSHFNVNLPLVDPGLRLGLATVTRVLDAYCLMTGADLLHLCNQPVDWRDAAHPFLCMPHYAAPDDIRLINIADGDCEKYFASQLTRRMRSQLRRKAMKFGEAGTVSADRATTPEDVERFLAAFLYQKSKRLGAQEYADSFGQPGVPEFLREAAMHGLSGTDGMEMRTFEVNGHPLSVRAGVRHGDHHSLMLQSFDSQNPLSKYSPGECLLAEVLMHGCKRGVTSFDFGVGDGRFKKVWANGVAELFNVAHAASNKGRLYAGLMQLTGAAARYIKRNPRLFSAVQEARALSARFRGRTE